MKTLEDEQYVVIKAYKFTVFEIWRDFNVLSYIACLRYPYIRVYRLYDSTPHRNFQEYNACVSSCYLQEPLTRLQESKRTERTTEMQASEPACWRQLYNVL